MNNKKIDILAFSLIELSIVLIIIGLLIFGIIGGQNLIDNAKIRSMANEVRQAKQNLNTFYALKNRLPGDLNGDNKIGYLSGETYNSSSFPAPYDGSNDQYGIPHLLSAPFVDLFLAGISDFEPIHTDTDTGRDILGGQTYEAVMKVANAGGIPVINANKSLAYTYRYSNADYRKTYWRHYNYDNNPVHIFIDKNQTNLSENMKKLDIKIDDGNQNMGNMRGYCYSNYTKCAEVLFFTDINI